MTENNALRAERLRKLQSLQAAGHPPYPTRFDRSHLAQSLQEQCQNLRTAQEFESLAPVRICGRITAFRQMGGATFLDLRDGSGRIQLYAAKERLGIQYDFLLSHLDIGDFLGVEGRLFRTKRGELSVEIA